MPKINLAGVSADFPVFEPGTYFATLSGFKNNPKGPSGHPFITVEFTYQDNNDPNMDGNKAWQNLSLAPDVFWRFKKMAIDLGYDADELEGEVDTDVVLDALKGAECRLRIDLGEYEGKPKNNIKAILSAEEESASVF